MKVVAVIPAYNEEKTISEVVKRTKKFVDEVIIIDDGSEDKTFELAKKQGAIVLRNKKNKGVGFSRRKGLKKAVSLGADVIITLDADLQHLPEDIPKFVEKIKEGYDFVLGERDIKNYPLIKKFGNFWLNFLTNLICGTKMKDTESGYKGFSKKAVKKINLSADKYAIESEIIYEISKHNLSYTSIKINSPTYIKGVTVKNGIENFIYLLKRKILDL